MKWLLLGLGVYGIGVIGGGVIAYGICKLDSILDREEEKDVSKQRRYEVQDVSDYRDTEKRTGAHK